MEFNLIALAIPVFFSLILVEIVVARRRGLRLYRFNDSITNLACGIGQQMVGIFLSVAYLALYAWVHARFAIVEFGNASPLAWLVAFVGYDFIYYWWHRISHEVNFMWAMHVVHHQSQEYNLSVALRQAWFTSVTSAIFALPLAVVGIPPLVYATIVSLSLLYQFWIHTRVIDRLAPWFEAVFNTPSHHRVHHGINPEYIDRNHGGTLIVWDKLFGTFEPERAEVVYGTVKPHTSWNPIWANFSYWAELWRASKQVPDRRDRLRLWWSDPAWRPASLGGPHEIPPVDARAYRKWDLPYARAARAYVAAQFALVSVAVTALLLYAETGPLGWTVFGVAMVLVAIAVWGGLFEGRRWALPLEVARHGALAAAALVYFGWIAPSAPALAATLALVVLSVLWFVRVASRREAPAVPAT